MNDLRRIASIYRTNRLLGAFFRSAAIVSFSYLAVSELSLFAGLRPGVFPLIVCLLLIFLVLAIMEVRKPISFVLHAIDSEHRLGSSLLTLAGIDENNVFRHKLQPALDYARSNVKLSRAFIPNFILVFLSLLFVGLIQNFGPSLHAGSDRKNDIGGADDIVVVDESSPDKIIDFTAFPVSGTAPLTVVIQPRISMSSAALRWEFNDPLYEDGGRSTEYVPIHVYKLPGAYSVTMTAVSNGRRYMLTKNDYIIVEDLRHDGSGKGGVSTSSVQKRALPLSIESNEPSKVDVDTINVKPVTVKIQGDLGEKIKKDIEMLTGAGGKSVPLDRGRAAPLFNQAGIRLLVDFLAERLPAADRDFLISYYEALSAHVK